MLYMWHLNGTMSEGGQKVMAYFFLNFIFDTNCYTKGVHIKLLDKESVDSLTNTDCCFPVGIR